jgi:hypothetical protein
MMLGLGAILLLEPAWLAQPLVGVGLVAGALLATGLAIRGKKRQAT